MSEFKLLIKEMAKSTQVTYFIQWDSEVCIW